MDIKLASQEKIKRFEEIEQKFCKEFLNCNSDDVLITDESYLSDFSPLAVDEDFCLDPDISLKEYYQLCDLAILAKMKSRGILIKSASISMPDLYELLDKQDYLDESKL